MGFSPRSAISRFVPPRSFVRFVVLRRSAYFRAKFLGALTLGRAVRYSIAAFIQLAAEPHILRFLLSITTNPQWPS